MNSDALSDAGLTANVVTVPEDGEHVHYCALSPDNQYIAAVFGNGVLRIMSVPTLETVSRSGPGAQYKDLPGTSVRWFPTALSSEDTSNGCGKYSLVSVSSAGGVFGWHFSDTTLERFATVDEAGNEIATVDISPDGSRFITAGSDRIIRVYGSDTFTCLQKLSHGVDGDGNVRTAHVNRIFSARHVTPTTIVSAGWESPVQLWDTRTGRSFGQLHGAQPGSDCIEPFNTSAALFFVTSSSSTDGQPPILIGKCADGSVLLDESKRLCKALEAVSNRFIVSRMDRTHGHLWCLSLSPHNVTVVSVSSGDVLASLPLPVAPINMTLVDTEDDGCTAYIACHGGTIVAVKHTC